MDQLIPTRKRSAGIHLSTGIFLVLTAITLALGCTSTASARRQTSHFLISDESQMTPEELRIRIRALALPLSGMIEEAADTILAETTDAEARKSAMKWKINGIPAMQAAIFQPKPDAALLDTWALILQTRNSIQSGPGSDVPDEVKIPAMQAVSQMEAEIVAIAQLLGSPDAVDELREDVETWARNHPITLSQAVRDPTTGELARLTADNVMSLRHTAETVNETMADMATRMDVYTAFVPKLIRWQMEYMVEEVAAAGDLDQVVTEFTEFSNAVEHIAGTLDDAPALLTEERTAALEALQAERIEVLDSIHGQLLQALEFLSSEREAIFSTHLREERQALLKAIERERSIVLEALNQERVAALDQVGVMTQEVVLDSMKELVDHLVLRLLQVGAALLLLAVIVFLLAKRRRQEA